MKALILAAGLGTRLAPITDRVPKCLVPVNGKPIIFKQIENLTENGITDITVIAGYKADVLTEALNKSFPCVKIITSVDYDKTNNMYSAYLGEKAVAGGAFLMMNADVYFDSSVIKALLDSNDPDAIVVDMGRYIEESMKVVEKDKKLIAISKQIPENEALGSSIDVYKFSEKGGGAFFDKCREYIENGDVKKWSEVALNDILPENDFRACPLRGRWFEIDNHDDLREAEALFDD